MIDVTSPNFLVGVTIIAINLVPFIVNKPKYLLLTSAISLFLALTLVLLR